jgi:hypothetical protein
MNAGPVANKAREDLFTGPDSPPVLTLEPFGRGRPPALPVRQTTFSA